MSLPDLSKLAFGFLGALLLVVAMGPGSALAQNTTVSIESQEGEAGAPVEVPVKVENFNGIGSLSLVINYDPTILSFDEDNLIEGAPRDFLRNVPEEGELRISWFDSTGGQDPINIGEGVLFNITFSEFAGGSSDVLFNQQESQLTDSQANNISTTFEGGDVFEASSLSLDDFEGIALNETITVPLNGDGLSGVGEVLLDIEFDGAALAFEGLASDESGLDLEPSATEGTLSIEGSDPNGVDLNGRFAELEFTFLGGDSPLNIAPDSEVRDAEGALFDVEFTGGSASGDAPSVFFSNRTTSSGESVEVPLSTGAFAAPAGEIEIELTFDESALTFEAFETSLGNVETQTVESNRVRIAGSDPDGIDLGGTIGTLTFAAAEDFEGDADLRFSAGESAVRNLEEQPYNVSFEDGRIVIEATQIAVSDANLDFETVAVAGARDGEDAPTKVFTISNENERELTLSEIEVVRGGELFSVDSEEELPVELAGGATIDVNATYDPFEATLEGELDEAIVEIEHNADNEESPLEVALEGTAEVPILAVEPKEISDVIDSGAEAELAQERVANEADGAFLEVDIQLPSGDLADTTLDEEDVDAPDGAFDADELTLTLAPGDEAELIYRFAGTEVETTETFEDEIGYEVANVDEDAFADSEDASAAVSVAVTAQPSQIDVTVSRSFADPTENSSYQLVALPGAAGLDVGEMLPGRSGPNWRVFRELGNEGEEDSALGEYDGTDAFAFDAGRGFWMIAQDDWSFEGSVDAFDAEDPAIPLQDGWNIISNPLEADLDWSTVQSANDLVASLYRWDGGWEQVTVLESAQDGEAYYVLNEIELDELTLPDPEEASVVAAEAGAAPEAGERAGLSLHAYIDGTRASSVTLEQDERLTEPRAHRAPPDHFEEVSLRLERAGSDAEYATKIVPSAEQSFALTLRGASSDETVRLAADTWGEWADEALLVNEETGEEHDLTATSEVTLSVEEGAAPLRLHVGGGGDQERATPEEVQLRPNYPNPFSDATTVEYKLPEAMDVQVGVYNALGQRVQTLVDGARSAGTHQVTWESGTLPSGTYFVRLRAGEVTETRQVTLLR